MREQEGAATPHVLVKFSGAGGSAAEQRWADLLVCEHLALEHAATLPGITAAPSRILTYAGRTFIESERFDRVGQHGRLAICGLDALQHAFIGARSTDWPELAERLHGLALLDATSVAAVEHLWWFGRLIANTDMHLGNLSFHLEQTLRLAPAYDMLPMAYAPLAGGEVPPRDFTPALPLPNAARHLVDRMHCSPCVLGRRGRRHPRQRAIPRNLSRQCGAPERHRQQSLTDAAWIGEAVHAGRVCLTGAREALQRR